VKRRIAIAAIAAVLLIAGMTAAAMAAGDAPGSEGDPVVTKSYVDQKLSEAGGAFTPLEIAEGQKLIGGEGTELILRSGEAKAVSGGSNGIADLTDGQDLADGAPLQANHLLLIPRSDGRGLTALTNIWVLVRGNYTLVE
jgi:hypothetical protein